MTMRTSFRNLTLAITTTFGLAATAQSVITVSGTVSPCVGLSYPVHIVVNNNPPIDTVVTTGAGCTYSFTFTANGPQGTGLVQTSCDGGVTWSGLNFSWTPFINIVTVDLACNSTGSCNACFTTASSQPWVIEYTNCTSGSVLPVTYSWLFSDGSISNIANPVWNIVTPGLYTACLSIEDANGCTSTICDSVIVDSNGNIDPNLFPCTACVDAVAATDGPAGPPLPWTVQANNCSTGGMGTVTYVIEWGDGVTGGSNPHVYSQPGTYLVCITMADLNGCTATSCDSVTIDAGGNVDPNGTAPCVAGFWVMQAYETDSLDPGSVVPIPNELWIWNLSSGGSGNYQFVWNWGDGTPNSTEAYPTHVYGNGGPYVLCLTMYDGGCTDTACDSVTVDGNGLYTGMVLEEEANYARSGFTVNVLNQLPTGISERPVVEAPLLWPNPVEELINLSFNTNLSGNLPLTIMDMNGRVVRNESVRVNGGANKLEIEVNELSPGIYMMRFGGDAKAVSFRFVKR